MKKNIILTSGLAVLLTGALTAAVFLHGSYAQALTQYESQYAQLAAQQQMLEEKQSELNALLALEEEKAAQAAQLDADAAILEAEKDALIAEINSLYADLEILRHNTQDPNNDQSYYLEVYDALTEGLNKVKQYLADH